MAPKKAKSSGKSAKSATKVRATARPVSKSAAKPAKKAAPKKGSQKKASDAAAKKVAKKPLTKAAKPTPKATPGKPQAKKAAEKSAAAKKVLPTPKPAPRPAIVKAAPQPKAGSEPKSPVPARPSVVAPRHPERRPEAATARPGSKPAAPSTPGAVPQARPVAAARPAVTAKRPFSREAVRVGESRFAQPAGARPVFPAEFLERQRERLQLKKKEILAMYQKDLKSGQESNDSPTEDLVDRANNAYTRELAFSISDSERELMHQIDLAIERLQAGSYGFCLHTGQQIGQARLEAIPWAKYSVEAQELLEKGLLSEA